jgi:hypothetical protein
MKILEENLKINLNFQALEFREEEVPCLLERLSKELSAYKAQEIALEAQKKERVKEMQSLLFYQKARTKH